MKKRFIVTQIVSAIKKQEGGMLVKDICREFAICYATFTTYLLTGRLESKIWWNGSLGYCPVKGF